ncbi:MAG: succinate dehydrogenase iron-sulfur subunit [Candidatus Nitrosopolaris wilkensis]|nr:MAG: succinate dehydrogenase iron-sulfur subunit [Candidatus Nitrosopolaris wilkensis]
MTNLIEKIKMLTSVKQTHTKIIEGSKITIRDKIFIKVFRRNTVKGDTDHHYDTFEIPVKRWTTVLDALLYAKSCLDGSIAIRYSCRMASCGSCGMKINGIPRLACYTKVSELEGDTITCTPLSNFPHIRDLVTDFSQFFDHHRNMKPYIRNEYADIKLEEENNRDKKLLREFKQTPEEVDKYLQFSYCIKCGLCYSACPTAGADLKFPGPQALAQMYRYLADNRDNAIKERLNIVDNQHGVWRCHFPASCSVVCPKGVDPALGIQLLRGHLLANSKNEKKIAELFNRDVQER